MKCGSIVDPNRIRLKNKTSRNGQLIEKDKVPNIYGDKGRTDHEVKDGACMVASSSAMEASRHKGVFFTPFT